MCRKLIYFISFVLMLCLFSSGVTDAADLNLVGWWRLDESSGTTAHDSSGNGNDGTLRGSTQWQPGNGQVGGALEFDGATGHVTIPFSESLRVLNQGDVTIAAWFKADAIPPENKEVFQQGDGNGTGRTWLFVHNSNEIRSFLGNATTGAGIGIEAGAWYHTAVVVTEAGATDSVQLYVNGELAGAPGQLAMEDSEGIYYIGCHKNLTNFWDGLIDDVRLYNRALTQVEIPQVMIGVDPTLASDPIPADTATNLPRDVVLSWTPGIYADKHDVYFGTIFDDVNDADRTNTLNVLVGENQVPTSYSPDELLKFGQTYYWRVDEVNAPPTSHVVFKSDVWSFTTEPFAYAVESITATASSSAVAKGPENTVNGLGLDDSGLLHGKDGDDNMWLSGAAGPQPSWIEFQFDKVYKLHEMWVWNYNEFMEPMLGIGFKDVTIEYSTNGADYTTLGTTHQFAQAPGTPDYAHNTTVDFGGLTAKYVRLTVNSNWKGLLPQYGLSEVCFFYIPLRAREPSPDSGATDVDVDVTLSFRAGREAATHDLYLSTDEQAVIDGTAPVATMTETSHGPLSLDLGMTYYWKINEVNDAETPTTLEGDLWNFTTREFLVVDDIESYNDLNPEDPESNRIFLAWLDGYGIDTNGSIVGYDAPPFCEQTIVHSGEQSMPFFYANTGSAAYSEAELTLSPPQDWTAGGAKTLSLWFFGDPNNMPGQMYVKVNGIRVAYDGIAGNLLLPSWQVWNVDLASVGTNLQNVTTVSIGIDGNGASGKLLFDDIGLYRLTPAPVNEWRIAAGSDDAEEHVLDVGTMEALDSSDLELGYEGAMAPEGLQTIGCRWVGVPVPKGATITEAWVQFSADDIDNPYHIPDVSLIIEGELSPNPATFSSIAGDISIRPKTTAQVVWDIPQWMTVNAKGPEERTPDISSIIQEIVNQDGWAGSAIVLMFRDNPAKPSAGTREAESFDGGADEAPLLHISYQ